MKSLPVHINKMQFILEYAQFITFQAIDPRWKNIFETGKFPFPPHFTSTRPTIPSWNFCLPPPLPLIKKGNDENFPIYFVAHRVQLQNQDNLTTSPNVLPPLKAVSTFFPFNFHPL